MLRSLCLAASIVLAFCAGASAAGFGQLAGGAGCLSATPGDSDLGTEGCGKAALAQPVAVTVSPDGRNVYVAGSSGGTSGTITILRRDPASGALTPSGCVSSDGTDGEGRLGACTSIAGLPGADAIAVSADGASVFVAATVLGSVVAFHRDAQSGALAAVGCLEFDPPFGSPCPQGHVFPGGSNAIAQIGGRVFVSSSARRAVSTLPPALGFLHPGGEAHIASPCVANGGPDSGCANAVRIGAVGALAAGADGRMLYAGSPDQGIDMLVADPAGALTESGCFGAASATGCPAKSALIEGATALAPSPDGHDLYVASPGGDSARLARARIDPATGALRDAGCLDELSEPDNGSGSTARAHRAQDNSPDATPPDPCTQVPGLDSVAATAVTPDGGTVLSAGSGAFASFARDRATGALTETACSVANDSRCSSPRGLGSIRAATALALSPDGRDAYLVSSEARSLLTFAPGAAVSSTRARASARGGIALHVGCPPAAAPRCAGTVMLAGPRRRGRARASSGAPLRLAPGRSAWVRMRLPASVRGALAKQRRLRLVALFEPAPRGGGATIAPVTITAP